MSSPEYSQYTRFKRDCIDRVQQTQTSENPTLFSQMCAVQFVALRRLENFVQSEVRKAEQRLRDQILSETKDNPPKES